MALENPIALSFDVAGGTSPSAQNFEHLDTKGDKSSWKHATIQTWIERFQLDLYRRYPSRNGNFRGTVKPSVKFTRDLTVQGVDGSDLQSPIIFNLEMSVPVGATTANIEAIRQAMVAFVENDAFMQLVEDGMIAP